MNKALLLLVSLLLLSNFCKAQPSSNNDEDSVLMNVQQTQAPDTAQPTIDYSVSTQVESEKEYSDFEKDTAIYYSNFFFNIDSLNTWKKNKKYTWALTIDSVLKKAQLKKDLAKQALERKNNQRNTEQGKDEVQEISTNSYNFLNAPLLKFILWLLAACFLLFVVYQLFLSKGIFGSGGKKANAIIVPEQAPVHDIDADFETLYKNAYNSGDIRLAVRYLFLQTLQKLHQNELVIFTVDKTNMQYLQELPKSKKNDFAQLALYYEYVWYGNVQISNNQIQTLVNQYQNFINKI